MSIMLIVFLVASIGVLELNLEAKSPSQDKKKLLMASVRRVFPDQSPP